MPSEVQVTRDQAIAELQRRGVMAAPEPQVPQLNITPDMARAELARRQGFQGELRQSFQGTPDADPTGNILQDVGTALSNVPRSAMNVAGGLFSLLTPSGLASAAETVATGVGGAFDVFTGVESQRAKLSRQLFKEMTRTFREPGKTLINDPIGAALDIAGILTLGATGAANVARVGGKAATTARKLAQIADAADPINMVIRVGGKALGRSNLSSLAGVTTGAGAEAFNIARRAGQKGGEAAEAFLKARQGGDLTLEGVSEKVRKGVELLKSERSRGFQDDIANATLRDPLDLGAIRRGLVEDLDNMGIKVPDDLGGAFKEAADGSLEADFVLQWPTRMKPKSQANVRTQIEDLVRVVYSTSDPSDWRALHEIRQAIDDISKSPLANPLGKTPADNLLASSRGRVTQELRTKVEGFAKASDNYRDLSLELEKIVKALAVKGGGPITETELTKLGNLLNTRTSGNLGLRKDAIHSLEQIIQEATGESVNLMEELAGLRLANPETLGIRRATAGMESNIGTAFGGGVGLALGGPFAAAVGAALGRGVATLLGNMTVRSPRAVSRLFFNLGVGERKAREIFSFVESLRNAMPEADVRRGLTIAAAWQKAQERAEGREKTKAALKPFMGGQDV